MADPNPYVIELEDFSQRFERSQARKRAEEEAAMAYYDNFAEINGPFTEGVKEEMQELWGQIEDQFTLGNSTPQGRRKIKQLYNDYKNLASDALNFSQQLGTDIALIQQNPQNYKDPEDLLMTLKEAQTEPVNIFSIAEYANKVPKASDNLRYQVNILTPGAAADNLIKTFSSDSFYANGKRKDEKDIASFVEDVLLGGTYQPQDIAKMIAYSYPNRQELERLGGQSMLNRLANATEGPDLKDKEEAIKKYKDQLTKELINRLDTLNEQEKIFQRQSRVDALRGSSKNKPLDYNFGDFNVTDDEGNIITLPFSMTLPKQFKASFTEGEEDVTIIRKATDKFGNEGFIGTKDVVVIDPSTGEEITKNIDTFYTSDQLKGADADMERANKGSQNAFVLQKDKYSKDTGFAKITDPEITDPKSDLSSLNRTPIDPNDLKLAKQYNQRRKGVLGRTVKEQGAYDELPEEDRKRIKEIADNLVEKEEAEKQQKEIDKLKKKENKIFSAIQKKLDINPDGTDDERVEALDLISTFIEQKKEEILKEEEGVSQEDKLDKFNAFKNAIRKLSIPSRPTLDETKELIEKLNEVTYEKGGRVSNDTALGRIFNRVRKALIPS
jgi:hypothetical protein